MFTTDANEPHEMTDEMQRKNYYEVYAAQNGGRLSIFDPRRKNRTLDSSGFGKPASDQVTQGAPKPAPQAQPKEFKNPVADPLRPDEIARLKALIQSIDQSARPLTPAPAPTMADKARRDAAEALEAAREDDRLPDWKKTKKREATHDAGEPLALGHDLYTYDAADTASPYRRLGHGLYT